MRPSILIVDDEPKSVEVGEMTVSERLAVSGARAMEAVAKASGTRTVVAGAGLSHLAAALGRATLLANAHVVDLVFESGVLGYVPRPHDATLSNTRNLPTARHLSSTLEVLGMLLPSTAETTIAVLSAGVIDSHGNANSNRSPSGNFLVGGGGSTDIAAQVTTIAVVAADPRKFVETARFISYRGTHLDVIASKTVPLSSGPVNGDPRRTMRISELSESSGVPVPTIKFYLREGLLHPGEKLTPRLTSYDDTHRMRLGLLRVLREVGDVPVDRLGQLVGTTESRHSTVHEMLAAASSALAPKPAPAGPDRAAVRAVADGLIDRAGWTRVR